MTTDQMMTAIEAATVRRSEFSILQRKKKRTEKVKRKIWEVCDCVRESVAR